MNSVEVPKTVVGAAGSYSFGFHAGMLLRSQSGPYAGIALSVAPASFLTRIDSALFRVLFLRRLRLPLPLSFRLCTCGRPLDSFGHHRAACSRAGVLGRRGFAVESVAARVCREAGTRVTPNMMVKDMDLAVPHADDTRRLEVVADGLPLLVAHNWQSTRLRYPRCTAVAQRDVVLLTGTV